jgi:hypothetical protein
MATLNFLPFTSAKLYNIFLFVSDLSRWTLRSAILNRLLKQLEHVPNGKESLRAYVEHLGECGYLPMQLAKYLFVYI